jgi:hypothetical protein
VGHIESADALLLLHDLTRVAAPDYAAEDRAIRAAMAEKLPAFGARDPPVEQARRRARRRRARRRHRPVRAGQLLLKHTKQLRLLRADLERDLQELAPSAPGGTREDERISIAINADSIATWAMGALHDLVRPAFAAGNHRGRPGFHPGMAALGPGAGLRHHAQAGAARLQDGAAGGQCPMWRWPRLHLRSSICRKG